MMKKRTIAKLLLSTVFLPGIISLLPHTCYAKYDPRTAVELSLSEFKNLIENQPSEDSHASDAEGNTILHLAVINGRLDLIQYLVSNHLCALDLDAKNSEGKTALDIADDMVNRGIIFAALATETEQESSTPFTEIVKRLIVVQKLPKIQAMLVNAYRMKEKIEVYSALSVPSMDDVLKYAVDNDDYEMFELLKEIDGDLNKVYLDNGRKYILQYAVENKKWEFVKELISLGADIKRINSFEEVWSLLMYAVENNWGEVFGLLGLNDEFKVKLEYYKNILGSEWSLKSVVQKAVDEKDCEFFDMFHKFDKMGFNVPILHVKNERRAYEYAIDTENLQMVKKLISFDTDTKLMDHQRECILFEYAVKHEDEEVFDWLVNECHVTVNSSIWSYARHEINRVGREINRNDVWNIAIEKPDTKWLKKLICTWDCSDRCYKIDKDVLWKILQTAVTKHDDEIFLLLDGRVKMRSVFLKAIEQNMWGIVESLIRLNINLNDERYRIPPIAAAIKSGNKEMVKYIINAGADVHSASFNVLEWMMRNSQRYFNLDIFETLITEYKVDYKEYDDFGMTPLHKFAEWCYLHKRLDVFKEVFKRLNSNGIDVNIQDKNGNTPLHLLAKHCYDSNYFIELLKEFKRDGIDVNSKNGEGDTPLHIYAKVHGLSCGFIDSIPEFEKLGIDVNAKNHKEKTCIECCHPFIRKQIELSRSKIKTLLDVDEKKEGDTMLHNIIRDPEYRKHFGCDGEEGESCLSHFLCDHMEQVNKQNVDGETPLHYVVKYWDNQGTGPDIERVTKLLLGYGAKLYITDNDGDTPVHKFFKLNAWKPDEHRKGFISAVGNMYRYRGEKNLWEIRNKDRYATTELATLGRNTIAELAEELHADRTLYCTITGRSFVY